MIAETYLSTIVHNRSFVDVGPLWVVENETLSLASHYGATEVAAIDLMPPWDQRWADLDRRMNGAPWKKINQDVCKYEGTFDVVHCAGVLYHHPNPIVLMTKLSQMTREHLILGTVVVDRVGKYPLAPGSCLYMPGVPPRMIQTLREDWKEFLKGRSGDVFDGDVTWDVNNLFHWWWLFTKEAVLGMVKTVGFQVRDSHLEANVLTLLLGK